MLRRLIAIATMSQLAVPTAATAVSAGPDCAGAASDGWLCVITGKGSSPGAAQSGGGGGAAEPSCTADGAAACQGWAPGPARLSTAEVVEMAMDAIMLPPPRPHTNPARRTWVGLRTFLWIDRAQWRSRRASVSAGGQTVTITGRPTSVVWDLGETALTCRGPGVPYRPGRTTYCGHTYRRSSDGQPGRAYPIAATIQYAITWTCRGACDSRGGSLGPLPATTRDHLGVGEIQTATH